MGELAELCGRGGRRDGEGAKDQPSDSAEPGTKDQAGRFESAAQARRDDTGRQVYEITSEDQAGQGYGIIAANQAGQGYGIIVGNLQQQIL